MPRTEAKLPNNAQFVTFRVDSYLLGIDILMVREINQVLDITEVPEAPGHILGLVNLRGQTITVFDLGIRLGLGPRTITSESHNVIFKYETVGLLVDQIGDVIQVEESEVEPSPVNTGRIGSQYIEGIVKLEEELLLILSPDEIIACETKGNE